MPTPPPARASDTTPAPTAGGTAAEVFAAFLKLGLTAFGGPIAHLGYFREEFVRRRGWIDEDGYAELVALCQFLPGPASSQVGFALGLLRAGGLAGGLAAWVAFTLPSAVLLLAFASLSGWFGGPAGAGAIHGLKLVAVAVVAQAVWGMAHSLAPDRARAAIAFAALAVTTLVAGAWGQAAAILLGAGAGLVLCRQAPSGPSEPRVFPVSRRAGAAALAACLVGLVGFPVLATATGSQGIALFDAFYRAGALVFGGGHVVLPLLRTALVDPGWIAPDAFLSGYGAAQAVPGPLFTVAAYLGAVLGPEPNGVAGAALALVAVFLPGLLLVYGTLPFWDALRIRPLAPAAIRGSGAAVLGILSAALYDPVWTGAVGSPRDFLMVVGAFLLLTIGRAPPWLVVLVTALGGVGLATV